MGSVYKSLSWDKLNPFVFCWSANTPRKLDMCQSKESDFTLAADSSRTSFFISLGFQLLWGLSAGKYH